MTSFDFTRFFAPSAALLAALTSSACFVDSDPSELAEAEDELIGGVPATSPRLNAVGALAEVRPDGSLFAFCTATLVTPTMLVTAEHCVHDPDLVPDQTRFLIGPDARSPQRVVRVKDSTFEDTISGGFIGLGADVGIVHLAEPVTDIAPIPYAPFEPSRVGQRFNVLGYGVQDVDQNSDTRVLGSLTLRGVGGRVFERIFGSFEEFVRQGALLDPPLSTDPVVQRKDFDETLLLDVYEAWLGFQPGDAQTCFGDSGGPVIQKKNGKQTIFAVVSGGLGSQNLPCDFGGAFAAFGPKVIELLDREAARP